MTETESPAPRHRFTPAGRLMDSLLRRQLGRFVAELMLIVAGILIALAIDGWVSDARDRRAETSYLELLSRDIDEVRQQAEAQVAFERDKIVMAGRAYAALSSPDPAASRDELGESLALLTGRRTLSLGSATYDQMVSSGRLRLIRDAKLRDALVRYFDRMNRRERIIEKNNRDLSDYVYIPFLLRAGISAVRSEADFSMPNLNRATVLMTEGLGGDIAFPEDRILAAAPDAESWNDIRRHVLWRARIAAVGQTLAEEIVDETDTIAGAIADELRAR
jgi:hypothetical protein